MAFESVDKMKWENCLQMDADTTEYFEQIKNNPCTTPVLVLPDFHQPFEIETDALNYSLDTMITQSGQRVMFHFKTFSDPVRRYSTYEKEMYAIVQDLMEWRHYILGKETVILTDHKPLQFTPTQSKLQTTRKLKWINYLQQFQLVIKYRKGKSNATADCLGRPSITLLSTIMSMHGYDTTTLPQLYSIDNYFYTIYR